MHPVSPKGEAGKQRDAIIHPGETPVETIQGFGFNEVGDAVDYGIVGLAIGTY